MTNKVIELDSDLVQKLYNTTYKDVPGWEFIEEQSDWDGGEERSNTTIVKNLEEGYLLSITNGYDSWDTYWDPYVSIVTVEEILIKKNQYHDVKGTTVKIV